jgi:hypothetical protein
MRADMADLNNGSTRIFAGLVLNNTAFPGERATCGYLGTFSIHVSLACRRCIGSVRRKGKRVIVRPCVHILEELGVLLLRHDDDGIGNNASNGAFMHL